MKSEYKFTAVTTERKASKQQICEEHEVEDVRQEWADTNSVPVEEVSVEKL